MVARDVGAEAQGKVLREERQVKGKPGENVSRALQSRMFVICVPAVGLGGGARVLPPTPHIPYAPLMSLEMRHSQNPHRLPTGLLIKRPFIKLRFDQRGGFVM